MRQITVTPNTLPLAKSQAYNLRDAIKLILNKDLRKTQAQSLWANCLGYPDWSTLQAMALHAHKNVETHMPLLITLSNCNEYAQRFLKASTRFQLQMNIEQALAIISQTMADDEITHYLQRDQVTHSPVQPVDTVGWFRDDFLRHAIAKHLPPMEINLDKMFYGNFLNINYYCELLAKELQKACGCRDLTNELFLRLNPYVATIKSALKEYNDSVVARVLLYIDQEQASQLDIVSPEATFYPDRRITMIHGGALLMLNMGKFNEAIGVELLKIERNPKRHINHYATYWLPAHWRAVRRIMDEVSNFEIAKFMELEKTHLTENESSLAIVLVNNLKAVLQESLISERIKP